MKKRTKLICVAPGLGVEKFMRYNEPRLSVAQSSDCNDDIKSLIGQYDIVIVPYKETIMKEMDMNVMAVIPKIHRYSEVIELFIEDMKNNPLKTELEAWKQNVFVPITNNMDFITLDTGEFLDNSLDEIMKSPLGYNYPSNWLVAKKFIFDKLDFEQYGKDFHLKNLLLEIAEYSGNIVCVSSDGEGISLSKEVHVKGITAEKYYKEIEIFKQLSENVVIVINSRILGCPKDEDGIIDWRLVRQQLVNQYLLPKYQQLVMLMSYLRHIMSCHMTSCHTIKDFFSYKSLKILY